MVDTFLARDLTWKIKLCFYTSEMASLIRVTIFASLCVLTRAFYDPVRPGYRSRPKCGKSADIVFLVDDSRSIWFKHFNQEIDFVQRLITRFHVSSYKTRFAALTFSSGVREVFPFGRFNTEYEVRHALETIYQSNGGTTDTYKAIEYARDYTFRHARVGVPRILIIITDGGSQERQRAKLEATTAKLAGIQIFVIGIGLYLEPYHLEDLASEPTPRYLYSVSSFPKLLTVDWRIAEQVCQASYRTPYPAYRTNTVHVTHTNDHNSYSALRPHRPGYSPVRPYGHNYRPYGLNRNRYRPYRPHGSRYPLRRYPGGYVGPGYPRGPVGYPARPAVHGPGYGAPVVPVLRKPYPVEPSLGYGPPHSACLQKPAEVVFVVEQSSSLHGRKAVTFVSKVIEYFDIGERKTRVATVSYSEEAKVEYHLDAYSSKRELIHTTANIPYVAALGSATLEVRRALHTVRQEVFTQEHGYRRDAARVVIVITEERWEEYEEVKEEAFALTTDGVHLFTIGVGPNVDYGQLRGVCSSPHDEHVFQVENYAAINTIKETLAQRTCLCGRIP
ncbi:hypothetical protein RRG08_033477 [Elysia crispata]|uniref:VWFA domain-containing protein n=1 Tax=Elysia crispata TaxID=231223 RepID=A0AAE1AV06_9GAST|nr:hypothetical protein RRG08_033477 [Elysia crispata]